MLTRRRQSLVVGGPPRTNSLVNDLHLFVDHPSGETINRNMHPVMLFPFNDEIALEIRSIWFKGT